jgi:CDP-2,3-bis-(O-geranylgeranyl)-sn-glycerol synthase
LLEEPSAVHPHWFLILATLALILLANGLPALLGLLLGPGRPLDGGRMLGDGRPLFGPAKTVRGILTALVATPVAALVLGLPWHVGLLVALGAMLGDLLASFTKRRLGLPSSTTAPLLDTVPESLIPVLLVMPHLGLDWLDLALLILAFAVLDQVLTPLGHRLFARRHG